VVGGPNFDGLLGKKIHHAVEELVWVEIIKTSDDVV